MHGTFPFKAALCALGAWLLLVPGDGVFSAAIESDGAKPAVDDELLVFTAISLKEPLLEMIDAFTAHHLDIEVHLHAAASGMLARQIERGAPADLFLSAAPIELDRLARMDLLDPASRVAFAGNRLVIGVSRETAPPETFRDLDASRFDRIAIGNPRTVPAGRYAIEALRWHGLHESLASRLVLAENARQVLNYLVRGETAAGLIYGTDARLAQGDIVVGPAVPVTSHSPIVYQAAVPRASGAPTAVRLFLDFLVSEHGQEILSQHGFLTASGQ